MAFWDWFNGTRNEFPQPAPAMFNPEDQRRAQISQMLMQAGQQFSQAPNLAQGLSAGLGGAAQGALAGRQDYRQGVLEDFKLQEAQTKMEQQKRQQELWASLFPTAGAPTRSPAGTVRTPGSPQYASAAGPTTGLPAGAPQTSTNPMLAGMTPDKMSILAMLGPESGIPLLAEQTFEKPENAPGKVGELNAAIAAGLVPPGTTLQDFYKMDDAPAAEIQEYNLYKSQGGPLSFNDFDMQRRRATQSNTTVNVGPTGIDYGDPGKGLVWQRDRNREIVVDDRGAPVAIPFQGGEVWQAQQEAAGKAQVTDEQRTTAATIVTQDVDRAIALIQGSPYFTTGLAGDWISKVPGSTARDVRALLDTVKANAGFDRLQQMRNASPTGGALGQVSNIELGRLEAAIGNLEQSQSKDQLVTNLRRVRQIYSEIIDGPGGGASADPMGIR